MHVLILFKRITQIILLGIFIMFSPTVWAEGTSAEREFIMSCTYGVMAGTLVGAASLAFVDQPGENLQLVARGASIGLYLGIGLGFYTVYVLPKQIQKEEEERIDHETSGESSSRLPRFMIFPLASNKGFEGVGAFWQMAQF